MDIKESLTEKFAKVVETTKEVVKDITEAIRESSNESYDLRCINKKEEILDYSRIEDDVKRIYKDLQKKGDTVLGTHLILDGINNLMEINIYTKKNGEVSQTTIKAKVKFVTNVSPSHVRDHVSDELKNSGRVELNLKF